MTNAIQSAEGDGHAAAPSGHTLFVVPRREGSGFQARVRGHVLDLIEPESYAHGPTPNDLFVVSLAVALAWSAVSFLRTSGLPEYVSVFAEWVMADDSSSSSEITLTVTVSEAAEPAKPALVALLEESLATRFLAKPVVQLSFEGS